MLSVHFCFGLAPHMGQRTDNICPNVSFPGCTAILFNIANLKDGQSCSARFQQPQNGNVARTRSVEQQCDAATEISKRATNAQLGWHRHPQMQRGSMLIDHCCRLGTAVTIRAAEIKGGDAMLAVGTFERGATIHRFGRVISHSLIIVLLALQASGQ